MKSQLFWNPSGIYEAQARIPNSKKRSGTSRRGCMCRSAHLWSRIEAGGYIHHWMIKNKSTKSNVLLKACCGPSDAWDSVLSGRFFCRPSLSPHEKDWGWGRILDIEICYLTHSLFCVYWSTLWSLPITHNCQAASSVLTHSTFCCQKYPRRVITCYSSFWYFYGTK